MINGCMQVAFKKPAPYNKNYLIGVKCILFKFLPATLRIVYQYSWFDNLLNNDINV